MDISEESRSLAKFEELMESIEYVMQGSSVDTLKDILFDRNSQELIDCHLSYFAQWLSNQILHRKSATSDPFSSTLTEYLIELPFRFDKGEVLLVLSGLVHSHRGQSTFTLWLSPIANCINEEDKWRFPRISPVFNDVTTSLSLLCKKAVQSQNVDDVSEALGECLKFYISVVGKIELFSLSPRDACLLKGHVLFLFAQPLSLIEFNPKFDSLFINSVRLYKMVSNGLFTAYNEITSCLARDLKDTDVPICIAVPAWLRLLTYILLEANPAYLENCWPLVFSPDHYIDLMHDFIVMLLDDQHRNKFISSSESHLDPALSEEVYIQLRIRAIEAIHRCISTRNVALTVSWWCPRRAAYMKLLKAIATQPVSTEQLPDIVSRAISCIDTLLKTSTYTAQCELFYELLPPKINEHHGFRGHLITLCKDAIHNCWLSVQKSGLQTQLNFEVLKGEESPQLPLQKHVLSCLCEMIFVYPHVTSSDSLVDQSSWILAAANMSLYIFLRKNALAATDPDNPVLVEVMEALLRVSDGSSRFLTKFFIPLKQDIEIECNRAQTTVHMLTKELHNADEKNQKKRIKSSLAVQEATLLRLRLLQVTVESLSNHCHGHFNLK